MGYEHCFETLANGLRLALIRELRNGPRNVTALAAATQAERTRVSHALHILRACKIVETKKRGREILYRINPDSPLLNKQGTLFSLIEEHAKNHCPLCARSGGKPHFP